MTLTYDDKHKPADGSVNPDEVRLWMYRLRKALAPARVRFFLVAEYGEKSYRPHYHLSVFGAAALTPFNGRLFHQIVHSTWSRGHVLVADFSPATAAYVSGYIVKHLVDRMDPVMATLRPVFTRQSLRPGLGATFMRTIADTIKPRGLSASQLPRSLMIGRKTVPLDRYLLSRLRDAVGVDPDELQAFKDKESWERSLEMRFLFEEATAAAPLAPITLTDIYHQQMDQKIVQRLKRFDIWQQSRSI